MKALLLCIILVVFAIMNTIKCPGCQKSFNQGKAIKNHQRSCGGLHVVAKEQFRKRGENVEKREVAKLAKIDGQTLDDIAEERQDLREDLDDIVLDHSTGTDVVGQSSTVRKKNSM